MRIIVDGDACPDKDLIASIAIEYNIEMKVFCDYAHLIESDDYEVIGCDVGKDSVDMAIVKQARKDDIVITQDYGLADLLLIKNVHILHVSGKIIDFTNIDGLMMSRHISAKARKASKHLSGPPKRTQEDSNRLKDNLIRLIKGAL